MSILADLNQEEMQQNVDELAKALVPANKPEDPVVNINEEKSVDVTPTIQNVSNVMQFYFLIAAL